MAKPKVIITPNYRDPLSRARWLVYDTENPRGRAVVSAIATGVKFAGSPVVGWGVGGEVVVHCEEVETGDDLKRPNIAGGECLDFKCHRFLNPSRRVVTGCNKLFLGASGTLQIGYDLEFN